MKETMVIFGVSGFIGSSLAQAFSNEYRIIGTFFENPVTIPGVLTIPCDILDKNRIQQIMYTFKPKYTLYCVGLTSVKDCYEYPKVADALNTTGVFNVSIYSERYGSKLCYFSNPYVFPGEDIKYNESDSPMPCSMYGNTVASTEFFIQKSCLNYLVLRVCNLYGRSINPRTMNLFEQLEYKALINENMSCDGHIFSGFLDISLFAFIFKSCLDKNVSNRLLQVSSSNIVTRYEFAQTYAKIFKQNSDLYIKGDWDFPADTNIFSSNSMDDNLRFSMDTMNLQRGVGVTMPTVEESLNFTYKRLKSSSKSISKNSSATGIKYI